MTSFWRARPRTFPITFTAECRRGAHERLPLVVVGPPGRKAADPRRHPRPGFAGVRLRSSARLPVMHARTKMKTCAQCHGRLGLGVRARNVWNGRWWVDIRFCSARCERRFQVERYDGTRVAGERSRHPSGCQSQSILTLLNGRIRVDLS